MKRPVATNHLLERLLAQPSVPFREGFAHAEIQRILDDYGIPHFTDETGNVIAGVKSFNELGRGFRIVMMAHMDHPGFHVGERVHPNQVRCYFYGGAPFRQLEGAPIRIFDPENRSRTLSGRLLHFEDLDENLKSQREDLPFLAQFDLAEELDQFSRRSFGMFDFNDCPTGCDIKGDTVFTRGADDLAGCVIALGALIDQEATLRKSKSTRPQRRLTAIFTRAEEVGFIGCVDLLRRGDLPEDLWFISLEASKALPDAEMGKGPVLRLGDRRTLFDCEFSAIVWQIAQELQTETAIESNGFRFQRRIMGGGTCEGTPLTVFGYQVAALAVPLMNYHNSGARGAAPEMISLSDTDMARKLCFEIGSRVTKRPDWRATMKRDILSDYKNLKNLLRDPMNYDGAQCE